MADTGPVTGAIVLDMGTVIARVTVPATVVTNLATAAVIALGMAVDTILDTVTAMVVAAADTSASGAFISTLAEVILATNKGCVQFVVILNTAHRRAISGGLFHAKGASSVMVMRPTWAVMLMVHFGMIPMRRVIIVRAAMNRAPTIVGRCIPSVVRTGAVAGGISTGWRQLRRASLVRVLTCGKRHDATAQQREETNSTDGCNGVGIVSFHVGGE